MEHVVAEIRRDHIANIIRDGKRVDGRGFDDYRPITIETDIGHKADGSALVKMGDTQVMAGIKLLLGQPFSDMPNSGVLTTNAELRPGASPTFEAGPPKPPTVEIARVVDRGIRESGAIDVDKLCITEGELCWIVFVDMHVLDYSGNLFDAGMLSSMAALLDTRLPKVEDGKIIYGEKTNNKLPIANKPVETTFAKIGSGVVLDPNLDEERVMDARLTVATDKSGDMCAMQKGGEGTFTPDEIFETVERGAKKAKELQKLLKD
ncbi:exosome complex protein Rrp42 [archaeon]|nr:exosome complex protein Rrp42 [archaeon]